MGAKGSAVSQKELARRQFILHGNPWKVVLVIAAPLLLFTLFNYAYSIIDTIMCSEIGENELNAVGALSQANNLIAALGGGLSAGGSILVAREIGKKNYEKAKSLASALFLYVFAMAILTCALIIPFAAPILRLLNVSETSIEVGQYYFMVLIASSACVMVNTVFMGVEKAKGSTLMISLLNMGVVLLKIGLNALFIYGFGWKEMVYVSLATLLANAALTLFILIRLATKNYLFHFSLKNADKSRKTARRTLHISFPVFLGKFVFSLGKVVINALCKNFGESLVGALGVSNNMGGSVTTPIQSIEDSESSIISQNLGAKQTDRALKMFFVGLAYALGIAIVGVVIVSIFNDPITHFFARKAEDVDAYAAQISEVFFYEKMGIITLAINSAVLGLLYGFGETRIASAINISRVFVYRIPIFLICSHLPALEGNGFKVAGISMGVSNILIGITSLVVGALFILKVLRKKKIKEASMGLTENEKKAIDAYLDAFLSQYKPYKNGRWCYEDGVVLNGAYSLYKATKERKYLDFVNRYFEEHIGENGEMENFSIQNANLDDLQPGATLFQVNEMEHVAKFEKAIEAMAAQFPVQPRLQNGSFIHKNRYPSQLWLDGLFMASPFYAMVASKAKDRKAISDLVTQFKNVETCNVGKDGLYYHCYDETKTMQWANPETGRSPHVWLRSVGWLAMADCDVASILQENGYSHRVPFFKKQLRHVLSSLAPFENPTTRLYKDLPALEVEGNYEETSGSIMLAYGYLKGARIGLLPYEETAHGAAIFEGVVRAHLKDGHLGNICLVSGLDNERRNGSIAYYLSEPVVADDSKGVGPFMMAYSEYLRG